MTSSRTYRAILAGQWAIEADWLPALAAIAARSDAPELAALRATRGHLVPALEDDGNDRPPSSGASTPYAMADAVAIIPVVGPIFPRANLMTAMSGATSLAGVERAWRSAQADQRVRAILLDVDSPGGLVAGVGELSDTLFAGRGSKPWSVYVRGGASSAAYWIATAAPAGELWVAETGHVGSIGVVTAIEVQEEPDAQGRRRIEVVSSNARNKRPDPRSDEGLAEIRRTLDALETRFVAAVARNRGVSAAHVLENFGQGGVEIGSDAVAAGMADRVGSFDQVLSHLAGLAATRRETSRMTTTTNTIADPPAAAALTAEIVARDHGAIAQHFRAEGAAAERARILGVEAQALPGHEALVAELKADGKTTPEMAAVAILAAEKKTGQRVLAGLQADGTVAAPAPAAVDPAKTPAADASLPLETRAKNAWAASAEIQAEFGGSFERYHAYLKASEGGKIRTLRRAAASAAA